MKKHTKSSISTQILKPLSLAISSCILVACSSTGTPAKPVSQTPKPIPQAKPSQQINISSGNTNLGNTKTGADVDVLDVQMLDALEALLQATDMSMVEGDELAIQRYGNLWDRVRRGYRINEMTNARIEAQKSWFYTRQTYLDRLTARASRYLHHTVAEAERRGIPSELALLPIIESSYDPTATSNAAAAGLWQFIPSTGRIYGLNQSATYDGRRDVIESTRAAYDFLTSLYNQFGSWELALAAYNAGPGRVSRAIKANQDQGLPTDYWSLKLPTETMNYVPRFLAVAQIVRSPNTYGINLPAIANHSHFRTVPVNYGVSLSEVATVTGLSVSELRLLNPALLNFTVDEIGPNRIVIPDSLPNQIDNQLASLKGYGFGGDYIATAPAQSITYVVPKSGATANTSSQQELIAANTLPTTIAQVTPNNTIVQEPALSKSEINLIAAEIQKTSPEVPAISPQDGNIQLNAVQTGQSVLDARGETKMLSFADGPKTQAVAQQPTQPVQVAVTPPAQPVQITVVSPTPEPISQPKPQLPPVTASIPVVSSPPVLVPPPPSRPRPEPASRPKPKPESYTVRAGDSLTSVAATHGLTVGQLASYNNLANDAHILIGQRLWLVAGKVKRQPVSAQTPSRQSTSTANTNSATHKVSAGESLTAIARKYNISLHALAKENGLSVTDGVLIGQTLKLPSDAKTANTTMANTSSSPSVNKPESYTVRAGDSLTSVAATHGLTVGQLASYNNLANDAHILIGQRLWLVAGKVKRQPVSAQQTSQATQSTKNNQSTATHRVQSGESLTAIARRYNISLHALAKENGLSVTDGVLIGQTLKLPSDAKAESSTPSRLGNTKNNSTRTPANTNIGIIENYTVRSGDSLTMLSNRFGVAIGDLATANGLASNANLRIGQTLKVPKLTTTYTVKAGDGLIALARRYGISTQELAKMNNLEPTADLRIGQVLTVPNK
ncbi:LysM peptidoglycan-binding domain-containing protein [Moraxella catarrhalis]|uniref:LysM peptidoglycan-binding domain-containing protein n=2 Tax=Moraxella catarrhalis TaxID=480 RepID=UPI000EA8702E|nr:LysM peptidoglycan-binding domain-containing protein [Moraxella catarrhalis]MPW54796.1 LysM peptidoglycan-binding domain-containing protein [Moraxella catarrhalis]MPX01968.1 lytic transglycosylase [Moraxella catarrhalis]MPX41163.1 LysM peptidoglycan-binding domain-containing protein [Moraxella catarrhalis]RKL95078.1 LysM peptidoglycan-binding domain-containing protein [Moraxella catarrhalis]RKL99345.1 LysM peptidoglycan-binding domain-containing protein [Moraxella catarrhalis]